MIAKIFWQEKLKTDRDLKFQMLKHSFATAKSFIDEKKLIDYISKEDSRFNFGRTYKINLDGWFTAYKLKDLKKQINFFVKSFCYVKAHNKRVPSFWYINDYNELIITIIERVRKQSDWSLKVSYYATIDCLRTFYIKFFEKVILALKKQQIKKNIGQKNISKHTKIRDILYRKYDVCKTKLEKFKKEKIQIYENLVQQQILNLFGCDVMYFNEL